MVSPPADQPREGGHAVPAAAAVGRHERRPAAGRRRRAGRGQARGLRRRLPGPGRQAWLGGEYF